MIINNVVKELTSNFENSQKMVINVSSNAIRQRLVNMYTDPHSAIVRELCSNCVDIHIRTDNNDPYLIKRPSAIDPTLIFRDFGSGLSPEDIHKYLNSLYSTSKAGTNKQVGGFGLGSKSPFALVSTFTLNSYIDGIKHECLWFKDEEDIPVLNILSSTNTTEKNGLEYIINLPIEHHDKINSAINYMTEFFPIKALVGYDYSKIFSEGSLLESHIKEEYEDYFIIKDFTSLINQIQSNNRRYHNNYYEHIISIGGVLYTYSSYLGSPGTFNTSNIVYKVPIGLLDLPDTREQLQYTTHNKSTIEEIIKNLRIKYYKQKEEELKILALSVKNEDIVTQLQIYSEFSALNGFNLVNILNHSSVAKDLVIPEELRFRPNYSYVQLLTDRLSCRHITRNYNNSAFNSNSKGSFYVSYVESTPNFVCIIDDLKKLPLSQLDYLDEEYKRDSYIRVDIDQNSNINFDKLISFFNTLILPYYPNARIIKASDLFTKEVFERYKDNRPVKAVVNTSTVSSGQTIKPLTSYRTIECTGKNTSQDFKYSNLNVIEHNGSDNFDKSYAKHFKGIIVFGFSGPDEYIGTLNTLATFAQTYSKTVTYFRCTKGISSEIEKEFITAFEDNEDCFVFNPKTFANSISLLSYISPNLIDHNIGNEYLSLLYMEYNLSWEVKRFFFEIIVKGSDLYPIANEIISEVVEHHRELNPSQDMTNYVVSLHQILNKFRNRLNFNSVTDQIVTRVFSHSGYCMIEESRIPALARDLLERSYLSNAYLNGREYTLKDYILNCIPSTSTQEVQNEH